MTGPNPPDGGDRPAPPPARPAANPPRPATPGAVNPVKPAPGGAGNVPPAPRTAAVLPPRPRPAGAAPPNRAAASPRSSPAPTSASQRQPPGAATTGPTASADSSHNGTKRFTPRSARTAIEPDRIDLPIRRRSKTARHPLIVIGNAIISIFLLIAVLSGIALFLGTERFNAPGPLAEDRIVNIPHGSGMRDIADVLTREGVIDQPWVFMGGVLVLKAREGLKAGEYQFKSHSSLRDVVATIVEGKVVTHQVSIPEGLTSEQIVSRLLTDNVLTGDIKEIPAEGTLLPDTYNFTRGVTRQQMIERMQQAEQRAVIEIWDRRSPDLPISTPNQLVTLASLVEKETGKADERTRVAAVFVNRLKQKMRLQSDPTIIYGLVGGKGTLGRPIMKSEIMQPTPYNTYVIDGLPPGPITNPGRASLEAAANPARTRDLYFVADGAGGHVFAETYDQHQKNVARLRLIQTDQQDKVPIDDQMNAPPPGQPGTAQVAPPGAAAVQPPLRGVAKPAAAPAPSVH